MSLSSSLGAVIMPRTSNSVSYTHLAFALSGGQQQRLCIARALAVSPSVLLMDEPASALEPISTAKVEELIHELKKEYSIVIVTNNMQQAARVSDKTAFFYMGNMVAVSYTHLFPSSIKERARKIRASMLSGCNWIARFMEMCIRDSPSPSANL